MSCLQPTRVVQDTAMSEEMRRISEEARNLAHDLVSYRIGKMNPPPTRTAAILRRLSDELEDRHSMVLSNMCNRLNVVNGSAQVKFVQVADEVFRDGINWGRIVAIFAFGAKMAQYCVTTGLQQEVEEIIVWVGNYISGLSNWIHSNGGWEAFNQTFGEEFEEREKLWWKKVCLVAVGFGAIATLIYQSTN